jgi:hypothetical protein
MKTTAWILSIAALIALAPGRAAASCPTTLASLGERFDAARAVFVGRAVEVTEAGARLEVEEAFKGVDRPSLVVRPEERGDCVVRFAEGERYVVFASPDAAGVLRAALDGGTGLVAERAEALVYCRRVAATGRAPSLVGTVADQNPTGLDDWHTRLTPLARARVVLEGGGRTFEALTDGDGVYCFEDVPPGKYSVRLALPDGYRLLRSTSTMHGNRPDALGPAGTGEIEIAADGRAARYFDVTGCGSLGGEVVDRTGAPAAGTMVVLATVDRASDLAPVNWNAQTQTDARGRFRFDIVPQGEFVVHVDPHRQDAFDGSFAAFHRSGARVANGRHADLGTIRPPAPFPNVAVDVSVAGPPASDRRYFVLCTSLEPGGREHLFLTDEQGRTRFFVRRGARFRIQVSLDDETETAGDPVEVEANGPLEPLRFVVREAEP